MRVNTLYVNTLGVHTLTVHIKTLIQNNIKQLLTC